MVWLWFDFLLFICFILLVWVNFLCFGIFLNLFFFCLFFGICLIGRVEFCWCCCVVVFFLRLYLLVFCIWVGKLCFDNGGRGFWLNFGYFCFEKVVDFLIIFGNWRKFCFLVLFISVVWIFFFVFWCFFLVLIILDFFDLLFLLFLDDDFLLGCVKL